MPTTLTKVESIFKMLVFMFSEVSLKIDESCLWSDTTILCGGPPQTEEDPDHKKGVKLMLENK